MNPSSIGFIIKTLGELMIGYSILSVHSQVGKEGKIDSHVRSKIINEKYLTILGIAFILIGFLLELPPKLV